MGDSNPSCLRDAVAVAERLHVQNHPTDAMAMWDASRVARYQPGYTAQALAASICSEAHVPEGACEHVLQQVDLVLLVLLCTGFDLPEDVRPDQEFRVAMLALIKRLFELARISRTFYLAIDRFRWDLWTRVNVELAYSWRLACKLLREATDGFEWMPLGLASTQRILDIRELHEARLWPRALYNFDVEKVPVLELPRNLKHAVTHLPPADFRQMVSYLKGYCACCDGECELYGPGWRPHLHAGPPPGCKPYGAYILHPYEGVILPRDPLTCGCTLTRLEGVWVPHTHPDHFVSVVFAHGQDRKFDVHMDDGKPNGGWGFTTQERQVYYFLVAARGQPWYATSIARIFKKRAERRRQLPRCHHYGILGDPVLPGARPSQGSCHEFRADVCLFTPRMPVSQDRSLQQIFGLTRKQVLDLIRQGRGLWREQRRLS